MRSVGASQQVPTRSRNYRRRSREIVDNARRYFSPKKSEGSSSSRFKNRGRTSRTKLDLCSSHGFLDCASNENVSLIEDDDVPIPPWTFLIPDQDGDPMTINIPSDVNMNNMQIPEHVRFVSVEKVSTLLRMIVGLQNILVSKMLESRDRLNASNVVIHELRRRIADECSIYYEEEDEEEVQSPLKKPKVSREDDVESPHKKINVRQENEVKSPLRENNGKELDQKEDLTQLLNKLHENLDIYGKQKALLSACVTDIMFINATIESLEKNLVEIFKPSDDI
ncbi:hypothetical protein LguiB_009504 [Lonicera macranthoides]